MRKTIASVLASVLFATGGYAQTLPTGMPVLEDFWRREQLAGKDSSNSFLLRPLHLGRDGFRAFLDSNDTQQRRRQGKFQILPFSFRQQYNSHHPYGRNDGSMIPANGYQSQLTGGIYTRVGPLSVQLQPEMVFAQNAPFTTFPTRHSDSLWDAYYTMVLNKIDAPQRFGTRPYTRMFWGQSSVRLHFKKLSFGLSTENIWWGPGVRNALIMSNNAPGFPHLTLNTTAPLQTPVGSFEGQLLSGWLRGSGITPPDTARTINGRRLYNPKPEQNRYLNGLMLVWQPKWTKGLYLGLSRVFYMYTGDRENSFNGFFPVIGQLFKGNVNDATAEDRRKRDQLLSLFFRLVLPKEGAEVYAEFGRNDHSGNLRDLVMQPEHSRAFTLGFRKLFDRRKKQGQLELMAEATNLQMPTTQMLRAQETWYGHYQVRHGYTNRGQVMGAGIGPGGGSQTIGLSFVNGLNRAGLQFERVVHNNDFYYAAFVPAGDFTRHWVDLSVQVHKSWRHKRLLYDARLTFIRSINFQWQAHTNVRNLQPALSVSYLF